MTTNSWQLPAQTPIVLLPIRLETRWSAATLKVRVIPDTVHIDTFDTALTAEEQSAGSWYWTETTNGRSDAAWTQLADTFSAERAAWIARATRAGSNSEKRTSGWGKAPTAVALPTRWQVLARTGSEIVRATGTPIQPRPLSAGFDPTGSTTTLPKWMTDFQAAIDAGMGIEVPLGPTMLSDHWIDRLLVYGVDENGDPAAGAAELTALLDSHYYTDGVVYLPPATSTNNSATTDSAYRPSAPAYRRSYQVGPTDPPPPQPDTAARRAAAALGLPTADTTVPESTHALTLAEGATTTDEILARAMNDALWATTWGYFLSQMMVAWEGEESRRLDHRNVIAEDAYLRSLDRQRLWPTAQRRVITTITGQDPGEPGTGGFGQAWQDLIQRTANDQHISADEAASRLSAQVDATLPTVWEELHGDLGTPVDDWRAATIDLERDRTARFAYFRWLNRVSSGGPAEDTRLDDWSAGQTAARYGPGVVRAARSHFRSFVRPGGPLPTLGIGRQPYGLLPVTSLERWQPDATEEGLLPAVHALRALRDTVWLPAGNTMPTFGPPDEDPNQALLDVMGGAPVSTEVFARIQLGPDYLRNLWRFTQPGLRPDWEAVRATKSGSILYDTGIAWNPRVAELVAAEQSSLLTGPLVTSPEHNTADWLKTLANPNLRLTDLVAQADLTGDTTPLLYRLLRHALLREYADAAINILTDQNLLGDWQHLDAELIGIRPNTPAMIWPTMATQQVTTPHGRMTLADYLQQGPAEDSAAGITAFRNAVTDLNNAGDDVLARHLMQTLDATSHRLDAWITSIATRRLGVQRSQAQPAAQPAGTLLGGFGWVTDLSPATQPDIGFVHAPSVAQAVTAAVLRSGYDAHSGGDRNPFAINLASDRVRMASGLLDIVRAGQPPGPALGYLFERRLQSTLAGQYIEAFRGLAATPHTAADTADHTATLTDLPTGVVDGLVLAAKLGAHDADLTALLDRIATDDHGRPGQPLRHLVDDALDSLNETIDATADALMTEAVHHAVNGSPTRAAATLDALAQAQGSVPQLEALRTPVPGIPITHRLAITMPANKTAQPHWPNPTGANSPRAAASPLLEILLQNLLPDPATIRINATVHPPGTGPISIAISLADSQVSAIDCVLSTPRAPDTAGETPSDLLAAALHAAARTAAKVATGPVDIDMATPADRDTAGLADAIELFRLLADLIQRSRPLADTDLATPDTSSSQTGAATAAASALGSQAEAAGAALQSARDKLAKPDPAICRDGLAAAARIGITGAAAAAEAESLDPAVVTSVDSELAARQHAFDAAGTGQPIAQIQAALGSDLLVLVPVTALNTAEVQTAHAAASSANFAPPAALRAWLAAAATVRAAPAAVQRFTAALTALRVASTTPHTVQLPPVVDSTGKSTEPWIGAAFNGGPINGPRTQLTYLDRSDTDFDAEVTGLLIDTWTETIPARTTTTGLAYRYPTPTNQPPQTMLLAVHPNPAADTWDSETLEAILLETLDLTRVRAVDPDALIDRQGSTTNYTGQLLPAAYIAFNTASPADTVSSQLIPAPD